MRGRAGRRSWSWVSSVRVPDVRRAHGLPARTSRTTGPDPGIVGRAVRRGACALRREEFAPTEPDGSHRDAIAVVGIACRFPSAPDPAAFWRLLCDGADAVGEVPPERWPAGTGADRWGAFLDGVDRFDAAFFGISPREARSMDPQQRLALELGWEALEDAGVVPSALRDSATGVFVGVTAGDYAALTGAVAGHHAVTGSNRAIIANRLSNFLGLRAPSLVVDTAQSSSLVADSRLAMIARFDP